MARDVLLSVGLDVSKLKADLAKVQGTIGKQAALDPKKTQAGTQAVSQSYTQLATSAKGAVAGLEKVDTSQKKVTATQTAAAQRIKALQLGEQQLGVTRSSLLSQIRVYNQLQAKSGKLTPQQTAHLKSLTGQYKKLGVAANSFMKTLRKTLARTVLWAVMWTAMYSVIRGVISAIGSVIGEFKQLDSAMARIRVVTTSASGDMQKSMKALESSVVSYVSVHSTSMEAATEALFKLSTAHLNSKEAAEAFIPTMDLVIATTRDLANQTELAGRTATVVAGIYNNYKDIMDETMTTSKKFRHIANLLAITFADQQVELQELAAGLTYTVGIFSQAKIPVEYLIASLGALNTKFVKNTKAGTGLQTMLVNIVSKAEKLAETFGIALDPNKPLPYIKILKALNKVILESGGSVKVLGDTYNLLGKRAGKAGIAASTGLDLIIEQVEEFGKSGRSVTKMMEERMNTIEGQTIILGNTFRMLGRAMLGSVDEERFISAIKWLIDAMKTLAIAARLIAFGFQAIYIHLKAIFTPVVALSLAYGGLSMMMKGSLREGLALLKQSMKMLKDSKKGVEDLGKAWGNVEKDIMLIEKPEQILITEELKKQEKLKKEIIEAEREHIRQLETKEKKLLWAHKYKMLEIQGANELYIIQQKIADLHERVLTPGEQNLELLKLQTQALEVQAEKWAEVEETIRSGVAEGIYGIIKGTQTWQETLENIFDDLLKMKIEEITKKMLYGDKIDTSAVTMLTAAEKNILAANTMLQAAETNAAAATAAGAGAGAGVGGDLWKQLPSAGPVDRYKVSGDEIRPQATAGTQTAKDLEAALGIGGEKKKDGMFAGMNKATKARWGKMGLGQKAFGALGVAAAGFGAYQAGQQQGPLMGALGGAMSGAAAGSMFGPWGTAIGGLVGGLSGLFGGLSKKKKGPEVREQTQTARITSKLDITNKELKIVNRNLVGLRRGFEGFVMTTSWYLRQRPTAGMQDQPVEFAVNSKRGYV